MIKMIVVVFFLIPLIILVGGAFLYVGIMPAFARAAGVKVVNRGERS